MVVRTFKKEDVEAAKQIAMDNFREERTFVPVSNHA